MDLVSAAAFGIDSYRGNRWDSQELKESWGEKNSNQELIINFPDRGPRGKKNQKKRRSESSLRGGKKKGFRKSKPKRNN